jgi:esterase/lipase superfamily enzyme
MRGVETVEDPVVSEQLKSVRTAAIHRISGPDVDVKPIEDLVLALLGIPPGSLSEPEGLTEKQPASQGPPSLILALAPAAGVPAGIDVATVADKVKESLAKHRDAIFERVDVVSAAELNGLSSGLSSNQCNIVILSSSPPDGGPSPVDDATFAWLMSLIVTTRPGCLILAGCYTPDVARRLGDAAPGVVVVGLAWPLGDALAAGFLLGFSHSLAGSKLDYEQAFAKGCESIDLLGMPDGVVPRIFTRDGHNDREPERQPALKTRSASLHLIPVRSAQAVQAGPAAPGGETRRGYTVWYGTDRKPKDAVRQELGFGNEVDVQLHCGRCEVEIAKGHEFARTRPWWVKLLGGDEKFELTKIIPELDLIAFWGQVKSELAARVRPEFAARDRRASSVFVYVHGFNVTFEGAAVRAAQIGLDLQVPGVMAFYSWPSCGTLAGYVRDLEAAEASARHLAEFLQELKNKSCAERVHVLVHSMGNRCLLHALSNIPDATTGPPLIDHLILAAADIDVNNFNQKTEKYLKTARKITLYTSSRDRALGAAERIRGGIQRVGKMPKNPPPTIVTGMDTIDASGVDFSLVGHGFYAESKEVMIDMIDLVFNNVDADRRGTLQRVGAHPPCYWRIR